MNYKTRQPFPHAAYVEGQRNFTYFDRSLTSGLTDVVIESPGDFLYIDQASTGVVSVELNMRQGGTLAPILLAAGGSIECDFASIKLNATAQLNKTVRVIVGNGARIKGGANVNATSMSVSVVDGGTLRTLANSAFTSFVEQVAVAGQYSHVQLYNPTASGKNIFIEKIFLSPASSTGFVLKEYNLPIANAYIYLNAASKKIGGTNSVIEQRIETNAGVLGAATYLCGANATANSVYFELAEPLLLQPAKGLLIVSTVPNTRFSLTTELYEE